MPWALGSKRRLQMPTFKVAPWWGIKVVSAGALPTLILHHLYLYSGQVKGRKLEIHRSAPSQHHAHTRKSNWSPPQLLPPNTRDGRSCTATHETQLRALKLYPARDGSGCGRRGGRQVCWMQVWGGTNLIPASEHEISPRRLVQLKLIRLKCT